ncbi:MAG: response regulator [bacterium]
MSRSHRKRRTILVVDDDEDVREAIGGLLAEEMADIRVLLAASGPEALALMNTAHVDLIVTDFRMQGMNGVQFLAVAQRRWPGVQHIMVTAFFDEAMAELADVLPGTLLLQKPFGPEGLLRDVEEALSGVVLRDVATTARPSTL